MTRQKATKPTSRTSVHELYKDTAKNIAIIYNWTFQLFVRGVSVAAAELSNPHRGGYKTISQFKEVPAFQ